jgi:hypothetical protein
MFNIWWGVAEGQEQSLKKALPFWAGGYGKQNTGIKAGRGALKPTLNSESQKNTQIPEQNSRIKPDKAGTEDKYQPGQPPGYVPQYYHADNSGAHLNYQKIVLGNQNPQERVALLPYPGFDKELADKAIGHDKR